MMSLYIKKEIPFKYVYFTGIVRDEIGRKMSKSLGNSPDPLDIIENHGADALRFGLLFNVSQGLDIRFNDALIDMGLSFVNKVWNASRFVLGNLEDFDFKTNIDEKNLKFEDKWIISRINNVANDINENMLKYNLDQSIKSAYEFFKGDFCDWYVEIAKTRVYGSDKEDKLVAQYMLRYILDNALRLLHPFIPFVTEYIWQKVKIDGLSICISDYPKFDKNKISKKIEKEFSFLQGVVTAIRNIRADSGVSPSKKIEVIYKTKDKNLANILEENLRILDRLANVEELSNKEVPSIVGFRVVEEASIYVPLEDFIDKKAEIQKIEKEIQKVKKELERVEGKLNNSQFISKAPEHIIKKENEILDELNSKLSKLELNKEKYLK